MVRAVIGVARELGLRVVVEGLEDMATVRAVRDLGAFAGQGFALSPAVDRDEIEALLARRGPLRRAVVDLDGTGGLAGVPA